MLWPSQCCMRVQVLEKFRLQGKSYVGDIYCTKAIQNAACQEPRGIQAGHTWASWAWALRSQMEANKILHNTRAPPLASRSIQPHPAESEGARRRHWMLRSSCSAAAPSHTTQEQPSRAQERVPRGGCTSGRAPASTDLQLWHGYFQADT